MTLVTLPGNAQTKAVAGVLPGGAHVDRPECARLVRHGYPRAIRAQRPHYASCLRVAHVLHTHTDLPGLARINAAGKPAIERVVIIGKRRGNNRNLDQ